MSLEGITPHSIIDPNLAFQSTADLGDSLFNPLNNTLPVRLRGGQESGSEEESKAKRPVKCMVVN